MKSSIDWFKAKITGKSHTSWENLWFPVDFPLSEPIEIHKRLTTATTWYPLARTAEQRRGARFDSSSWGVILVDEAEGMGKKHALNHTLGIQSHCDMMMFGG